MTGAAVFARLRAAGVELAIDSSGGIRCRALRDALTLELRSLIKEHRDLLLAELRQPTPSAATTEDAVAVARMSAAPSVTLSQLVGLPPRTFNSLCRRLIGRPGPSTSAEDAVVFDALARRRNGEPS